jgi:hypothetical protein
LGPFKGVVNETGNPVATVGVGETDEVGEIFYTKFKQNLDQYRHNKILDVGKYGLHCTVLEHISM